MSRFHRWVLKAARTVHVYLTLFGLALILFFAVTGFMLNHIEWFVDENRPPRVEPARPLPTTKLPGGQLPVPNDAGEAAGDDKLAVVEAVRAEFGITGELTSFQFSSEEEGEQTRELIRLEFRRAGEVVEVAIDRGDRATVVTHRFKGWSGVATDLHRGNRGNVAGEFKFTGTVWSVVIDATCVILLVIAVTGLILWWSLKSRGKWGAVVLLLGGFGTFAAYYWFVP